MTRKISFNHIRKAVDNAYDKYKNLDKGSVDPRVAKTTDVNDFGISFMLTDGTTVNKGNTDVAAALGDIASLVVHTVLLEQVGARQLTKLAGKVNPKAVRNLELPMSPHAIRAYSAVEPRDDSDGKYDIILDTLLNMTEGNPDFDDTLYQTLVDETRNANEENALAQAEYTVYDNINSVMNGYAKLESLKVTAEQLATIGATIAADGRNPRTANYAFDGANAAALVAYAAYEGRQDKLRKFMMRAGTPTVYSFSGLTLGIMPGLGAIAVYGPAVGKHGNSKKGKRVVRAVAEELQYNVFASARVEVVVPEAVR